jgi:hypothetical protein
MEKIIKIEVEPLWIMSPFKDLWPVKFSPFDLTNEKKVKKNFSIFTITCEVSSPIQ